MQEGKSIRFVMLVSPSEERRRNALLIKEIIPDLELVYADKDKCDLFLTHLESLKTDPEKYCGVVMMEDDIILSEDFLTRFARVMDAHSGDVVQFFEHALAKKPLPRGYRNGSEFFSCVCYYMPAKFTQVFCSQSQINKFKEWYASTGEPWNYPIDTYIQFVLRQSGMVYWREFPWIVQHLDFQSMFKGRSTKRQSRYFIDDLKKPDRVRGDSNGQTTEGN